MKVFTVVFLFWHFVSFGQIPCVDGMAGPYPCQNVDMLYHITPAEIGGATTNEVWGWTDSFDNREYLILGASTGVYFFDLSNPIMPILLGHLPTHTNNSSWRTFRTYNDFLFVCSEAVGHGMQIFDLTRLRDIESPPMTFDEDAHYSGFTSCHTLVICEEVGMAYACGTNTYLGGLHIVNIQDPLNPIIAGGFDLNGYTHEAQVVVYQGPDVDYIGHTIAFCYNGSVPLPVTIVDVTDPSDASDISYTAYPQQRYCHQGWLTPDGGYLLIDDELDEYYDLVDSLHTIIMDVHDLDAPQYMGYHVGGTSVDHNQIIVGNLAYQSNYTSGFSMLDITEIADTVLTQVAYFDHFPANDNQIFQGEWMSYPYFESGVVALTDIYNGAFLVVPDFIETTFPNAVCANDVLTISIELMAGFVGPFTIQFDNLPEGVVPLYNIETIVAPAQFDVSFTGIENLSGSFDIHFEVQGLHHNYKDSVNVTIVQPSLLYYDLDGDGYGDENMAIFDCEAFGYVSLAGDCQLENEAVYPSAPGTMDDIDNDCNNIIEEDEIPFCADLNGDLIVTVADILIFQTDLYCTGEDCIADLNNDGITSTTDLLILIADFGEECD